MLEPNSHGLYCPAGDFYVDPWGAVERAVITHAHADHARAGSNSYLTAAAGERLLRARLGPETRIETLAYGQRRTIGETVVSLHPAGHILGSAQVRIEHRGEVWVFSGDYKIHPDPTCAPFDPVRCHTFVTEATFGLPIFRWRPAADVFGEMNRWWTQNRDQGRASLLLGYPLGKAQRILAGVEAGIGPIFTHGSVERLAQAYRDSGVSLPATRLATTATKPELSGALIVAPLLARHSPWTRRLGNFSSGMASGWMQIRGTRRRRAIDRGFVLSDHADWPALLDTIRATQAEHVVVTHGSVAPLSRWLIGQGMDARVLATQFEGERDEDLAEEA